MAVSLTALAALLFYLGAVPVKIALFVKISGGTTLGAGVAIFEGRFALRAALRRAGRKRSAAARPRLPGGALRTELLRAALRLVRHLRLEALRAQGRICSANAARTALICGCAGALEGALTPIVPGAVRLQLQPDFSAGQSDATLCCILSLRAGHIMFAALCGAWHYAYRRISHGKASH